MYEINGVVRIERGRLPGGDAGTRVTLEMMRRLVHEGSSQFAVRWTALRIVRGAGVASHDTLGMLRALYRFVRDEITFVNDTLGVQVIQSPRVTLTARAGNCVQRAVLLAALAAAVGIPTSFKAIGADPRRPTEFSHVYLVAHLGRQVIAMDPTYGDNALGWQHPRPSRRMEVKV